MANASTSLPDDRNSLLNQFSQIGDVIAGFAKSGLDVYGSFVDTKLANKLAQRQSATLPAAPAPSQLNSGFITNNKLVTAGIVIAIAGTSVLLFRGLAK